MDFSRLAVSALLLLGLAAPAVGAPLDPPVVSFVSADRSSITLEVAAGPSGAPGGLALEWMTLGDYLQAGGWPGDGPALQGSDFTGVPTLNVTPGVSSYRLGLSEAARIVLGQLFDETGVSGGSREELPEGTTFVIRACAAAAAGFQASPVSAMVTASTQARGAYDCTLPQGFWKNHPEAWTRVASISLGSVAYGQAQLLAILGQPARGNGLVSLAHQLIAAKLNLLLGALPSPEISTAITQADALIGSQVVPPIGSGYLGPSETNGLNGALSSFNGGRLGPGHCPDSGGIVSTKPSTWGGVKAIYR